MSTTETHVTSIVLAGIFIFFMLVNIFALIFLILNIHRLSWGAIIFGIIFPPIFIVFAFREPESYLISHQNISQN